MEKVNLRSLGDVSDVVEEAKVLEGLRRDVMHLLVQSGFEIIRVYDCVVREVGMV